MYFVYILKSDKQRHYIGYTSDLDRRLSEHNKTDHRGFTHTTEHWEIEISMECETKQDAMNLEKYLKSMKNSKRAIEYLKSHLV